MLDLGFYIFYVLLAIAIASAVIFPLINSFKSPATLVVTGIGVAVMLVLFGVSYGLSDSTLSRNAIAFGLSESGVKMIGAGLIMFYIVLVLAILALIYSEISKAIK
jgi:hypothetical protein